jgi:hypothetical protein
MRRYGLAPLNVPKEPVPRAELARCEAAMYADGLTSVKAEQERQERKAALEHQAALERMGAEVAGFDSMGAVNEAST